MGIEITSSGDDFLDDVQRLAVEDAHEAIAQDLAQQMRDMGRTNADGVELDIESDTDDPAFAIDQERVRSRANELLRENT